MALDGVFMQVDVNDNFLENNVVCTMLFLNMEGGGNICFSKYPTMYERDLRLRGESLEAAGDIQRQ